MKTIQPQKSVQDKDHTRLYFNIFMGLLALGFVYMIVLLLTV